LRSSDAVQDRERNHERPGHRHRHLHSSRCRWDRHSDVGPLPRQLALHERQQRCATVRKLTPLGKALSPPCAPLRFFAMA
jgi:hypothetical protein